MEILVSCFCKRMSNLVTNMFGNEGGAPGAAPVSAEGSTASGPTPPSGGFEQILNS